jgi:hypothetical protein
MTEFNTNPITQADLDPAEFNVADLAALGEGHIAYVRAIRSDEVKRIFPQAPDHSARRLSGCRSGQCGRQ